MRLPDKTPRVVRQALRRYLVTRRLVGAMTGLAAGLAVAVLVLLAALLADRWGEVAPGWRVAALALAAAGAACGALAACVAFFRRRPVFPAAVQLDQALAGNEDRWATALNLLARQAAGEQTGAPENVERLLRETETVTSAAGVGRLVRRRAFVVAVAALGLAAVGLGFLHISPAFDMALLWNRLAQPRGNWPRDSFTEIRLLDVNGRRAGDSATDLPPLPEDAVWALKLAVHTRLATWWPGRSAHLARPVATPTPRLEILWPDGRAEAQECVASGAVWTVARERLAGPLRFRVRAGDGLTAEYRQPVLSRVRITQVEQAVRFPVYSRLPAVKRRVLAPDERISVLEGAVVDLFISCSEPARELTADLEILQKRPGAGAPAAPAEDGGEGGQQGGWTPRGVVVPEVKPAQRRSLKVTRTGVDRARVTLAADESGLLRLRATGANGLPGRERVMVIEAVPDAPPRLIVTGLESDSLVVPGEVVGFDYSIEDDLGVSDLVLEWTVAGGAAFEHLTGEEYVQSAQLGQKKVEGKQIIQRMNYYVYAQAPFEFRLVATDTKGQEARSDKFRINLVRDDFVSRFEVGVGLLKEVAGLLRTRAECMQSGINQLNILAAAVKGAARWEPGPAAMLQDLPEALGTKRIGPYGFPLVRAKYEYGDLPCRIEQSLALLLAAERQVPTLAENLAAAHELATAVPPAAAVEKFRAALATQRLFVEALQRVALAEYERFHIEQCCQTTTKLANRLELLLAVPGDAAVLAANVANYAGQSEALLKDVASLATPVTAAPAAVEGVRTAAAAPVDAKALLRALRGLQSVLAAVPAPASAELAALPAAMAAAGAADADGARRFRAAEALVVRSRSAAEVQSPWQIARLARAWLRDTGPTPAAWQIPAPGVTDVWFAGVALEQRLAAYRADVLAARFALDPARRQDVEAEAREVSLALHDQVVSARLAVPSAKAVSPAGPELDAAAQAQLPADMQEAEPDFILVADRLEALAGRLDQLAAALVAIVKQLPPETPAGTAPATAGPVASPLDPLRLDAESLQLDADALETAYRNRFRLLLLQRLGSGEAPPWALWQPYHGLQLAVTMVALQTREQVLFRLVGETKGPGRYQAAVEGARGTAAAARGVAGRLRQVLQGQGGALSFVDVMKETKTLGYMETLQAEYERLLPLLRATPGAEGDAARAKFSLSPLGRVAVAEQVLAPAVGLAADCGAAQLLPAALQRRLQDLVTAWTAQAGVAFPEALAVFGRKVAAVSGQPTLPPDLQAELKTVRVALEKEMEALRSTAQLPVPRRPARPNQRDREMSDLGTWQIADTIQNHDLRWQARVRDAELDLAREIVRRPGVPARLAMQFVNLVELRARQLSGERRRNQGFALLEGDTGPRLKLPKHIAAEFLRARNRKPPEQFQDWSEAYYEAIYRAARP